MIFFSSAVCAQNPYHITNYKKSDYNAGNQNWDIDLDEDGNVYIANSKGLLKLSGSAMNLYELPGKTIIRSVAHINKRVYTGSFQEFGFWEQEDTGNLRYFSLVPLLSNDTLQNDEFWKIVEHGKKVYFQSFGKLLCYDLEQVKPVPVPGPILFLLKCRNRLFTQQIDGGLYEIVDDELNYIEGSHVFNDTEVKAILPISDDEFLIGTSSKGIMLFDGIKFSVWQNQVSDQLKEFKINNGLRLDEMLVFGTIMKGIYILDTAGNLINHLHTGTSLQNNTVLALRSDSNNNLWIGLDKGFDYAAFDTPFEVYADDETGFGTVYAACLFRGILYVGTNHGIYYFRFDEHGKFSEKKFLPGTQGQVWFISSIDGELYCGLNDGTYLIRHDKLIPVSSVSGGFNLRKVSTHDEDFLLQSTYNELVVYRKKDAIWHQSHIMSGFGAPARFLEIDHTGNIWLGHTISGIFMVQPGNGFDSAVIVAKPDESIEPAKNMNRVFKVDNRIIIPTGITLLQWDPVKNIMVPYNELAEQLESFKTARTIVPASANRYWFINDNEIGLFEIRFGKATLLYRLIPEMYKLELVQDYENIVTLNDSLHLVCLENGFSILNLNRLNRMLSTSEPIQIKEVASWKNPEKQIRFVPDNDTRKHFSYSFNNLRFIFSAPGPAGKKKYFQFKLQGMDLTWNDWTASTDVTYNRLPPGSYNFLVRTLTNQGIITEPAQVSIRIRPPWYLSYFAFVSYFFLLAGLILLIRLNYLRRHWKNREEILKKEQEAILKEKERAERELIRLKNEKLQSEISMKNSQLANNTISLIRKNELLGEIQKELNFQKDELGQRLPKKYFSRINKLIEDSIRSDNDWELFEKLFDQAHQYFFQRLKSDFPDLTPSDLRLCAYLRLNLSSKEIAPLLNISVRGVEERRYRLRKRLDLATEHNLTEFILAY